jgi:glutamate-5-semialdehyde dehydrogenase
MNAPHTEDVDELMTRMGRAAREASRVLAKADKSQRAGALVAMAKAITACEKQILAANARDIELATKAGVSAAFLDRMKLSPDAVKAMANGIETVAWLPDPIGDAEAAWTRPNGLSISRVRVPIGVIGIVYESRPNVTADAAALCIKSGNAVILRGGSEALGSARAIQTAIGEALERVSLPKESVQVVPTADRLAVGRMLAGLEGNIDLVIPRGGKSLVARVQAEARVPVFAHLEGICHTYVDKAADLDMAKRIIVNAKMRRTGVCGATECLLVDTAAPDGVLAALVDALVGAGCEVRGDAATCATDKRVIAAADTDYGREFLDAVIAVKTVAGVDGAMAHIARYGSQHTDAIITNDKPAAERFLTEVDSAIVLHNASTQFADGGEFGFGAEIGIATGKMHARGPVGVEQLTSFKYVVRGSGQTRPG